MNWAPNVIDLLVKPVVEPANLLDQGFLDELKEAFSTVPYPVGDDYFKAIADRDYVSVSDVNPGDEKKISADIGRDLLLKYYDFLLFLKPDGIQYYLPAYIQVILSDPELIDHWIGETLLMTLGEVTTAQYSSSQLKLLAMFLNHIEEHSKLEDLSVDTELLGKARSNIEVGSN